MYVTSFSTFLNFLCSSQTFCSSFATFSSKTFSVNSILFFKSFISSRSFPTSCFVITRLFSIIFCIYQCSFANSSSKTDFISLTIISLSSVVFPLALFWSFLSIWGHIYLKLLFPLVFFAKRVRHSRRSNFESFLKITSSLQQFKWFFISFLILVLTCKETGPK